MVPPLRDLSIFMTWKESCNFDFKQFNIKERGRDPPRPEKTQSGTEIGGMLLVYVMRTELLALFDHLYLSHKIFPTNDFLHGLYIDPLGKAYQISS